MGVSRQIHALIPTPKQLAIGFKLLPLLIRNALDVRSLEGLFQCGRSGVVDGQVLSKMGMEMPCEECHSACSLSPDKAGLS